MAPGSLGDGFVDLQAFEDVDPAFASQPKTDKAADSGASVGCLADIDGDGKVELISGYGQVVTRTYDPGSRTLGPQRALMFSDSTFINVMAAIDLDGDGHVDFVTGREGLRVGWGQPNAPYEVSDIWRTGQGEGNGALSFAVADLDSDGWLDILVGTQRRRPNVTVFQRVGLREWRARPDWMPEAVTSHAYALLANEPYPGEPFISTFGWCDAAQCIDPPAFLRGKPGTPFDGPSFDTFDPLPVDSSMPSDMPKPSLTYYSPMGGSFGDIDGDGRLDLMVSGSPGHFFFQTLDSWPFRDRTADTGIFRIAPDPNRLHMIPWGAALVDLDGDRRLDLLTSHGNDSGPLNMLPPEMLTAHFGRGDFRFADGSAAAKLDREGQWHTLVLGDLDLDGDADFVSGRLDETPRLYRNDIDTGAHRLSLRLHGTTSNHLGTGARIWVRTKEGSPERLIIPDGIASPEATSNPTAFVGLGEATAAQRIRIEWSSGYVQELRDVAAGKLHEIVEPQQLTVLPSSRHVPADGLSTAILVITPVDAEGRAMTAAAVDVRVERKDGSLIPVPVTKRNDVTWRTEVGPFREVGETVVHVSINGTELLVHPRLWWDAVK